MTVPRRCAKVVLLKYGTSRNVVGYGNRNPSGVSDVCAEACGGADVVGGREGGNSDNRVSRHQKLHIVRNESRWVHTHGSTDRNDDSQSPMSCPFHLMTSRTWRMPFSLQFWSNIQSNTVSDGRGDGKRAMRGLPRTRERRVVLGTGEVRVYDDELPMKKQKNSPTPIVPPP